MINWHSNVFLGILGRTCDRPYEPACRRGRVEEEITASYAAGKEKEITLNDGSVIHLHKTGNNYDPSDKENALHHINEHKKQGKIATGLLYINQSSADLHELQDTVDTPLNSLGDQELCPGSKALNDTNNTFRQGFTCAAL